MENIDPKTDLNIKNLITRSVQEVLPSANVLEEKIKSGKKLNVYLGIDPTGPTLHIGHAIELKKLKEFQDAGHQVILLIGDFTATIGDPTDKMAVRKVLTPKEVKKNLKLYKKQASTFIRFSGKNKAKIVFNSKWLKKLKLADILNLMSMITVDQMLKRDMFSRRMEEGKPISMHEFMYPLLQGYDSAVLGVDVEIGGNDQMFNMMVGRDLQKKINNQDKVCITMKLLTDSSGKKMGKTEGNMVSLTDDHFEMFGKVMSWTDDMIMNGFELCTYVSKEELEIIKSDLSSSSVNPRDLKIRLAKEIISIYHGVEKANQAEQNFIKTFSNKEIPENVEEVYIPAGTPLSMILINEKIVSSMNEFKRLVNEGAVNTLEKENIKDFGYLVSKPMVVKVGKRRFLNIKIQS